MADPGLIMTLGKVMIAAAWVDGEISEEEINCLKDLMFQMPHMTALEWDLLDMYIETPIEVAERGRLIEELRNLVRSADDKALAIQAMKDVLSADGTVTEEEQAVLDEVIAAVETVNVGVLGELSRLIDEAIQQRQKALVDAPNRENYFDDFVKNKVFYEVRRRIASGEAELDIPEQKLRRLSLAGGMMAQIARVSPGVTKEEFRAMVMSLQMGWELTHDEATFIVGVATSPMMDKMDSYRLKREFFNSFDADERARFLDVLFAIAAADDEISEPELEEIRAVAQSLLLTHEQFIAAKTKISSKRHKG